MKNSWLYATFILIFLNLVLAGTALADSPARSPAQQPTPTGTTSAVRILRPVENGVVPVGEDFPVAVTAGSTAGDSVQWQFYLDGKPAGSATGLEITHTLSTTVSGPHVIQATLRSAGGQELGSAQVNVTAAPRTPDAAFNIPTMGPVMAVLTLGIIVLIVVSLRMTRHRTAE